MSVRRLAPFASDDIGSVPFESSRLLGTLGGMLFSLAARVALPQAVEAATPKNATPPPCYGLDGCNCCSGITCCDTNCQSANSYCSGQQCWYTCSGGINYLCCDYFSPYNAYGYGDPHHCICSVVAGRC